DLPWAGSCWDHDGRTRKRPAAAISHDSPNTRPYRFVALAVIIILLGCGNRGCLERSSCRAEIGGGEPIPPDGRRSTRRRSTPLGAVYGATDPCPGAGSVWSGSIPIGAGRARDRPRPWLDERFALCVIRRDSVPAIDPAAGGGADVAAAGPGGDRGAIVHRQEMRCPGPVVGVEDH